MTEVTSAPGWLSAFLTKDRRQNRLNIFVTSITNCTADCCWQADSHFCLQGIIHLLWNPYVHQRILCSEPCLDFLHYFLTVHFNIILIWVHLFKLIYSLQVLRSKFRCTSDICHVGYTPYPSYSPLFRHLLPKYEVMIYVCQQILKICSLGPVH